MKSSILQYGAVLTLGTALSLGSIAFGQDAVTTQVSTSTTSDGTVTEFAPGGDTVVLRSQTDSTPVTYSYSKTTTVVDDSGNPVDVSVIKEGVPIQVIYERDGDHMVARKIIVHHVVTSDQPAAVIEKKSTTTTTTTGSPQ
jgi:hypothetical protein